MNSKNLPLKFALLLLVVLVCLWSLLWGNGLKQGIDIRGGHSLIFEIRTNVAEIKVQEQHKSDLQDKLTKETDEAEKKKLAERIKQLEDRISHLENIGGDAADLPQQMISVLKDRVDPRGLRNLEWRPLGSNRIQVRMPAGSDESRQAKNVYIELLQQTEKHNVKRSEIRRVLQSPPLDRPTLVNTLAGDDPDKQRRLSEFAAASDTMTAADVALAKAKDDLDRAKSTSADKEKIEELTKALSAAQTEKDNAMEAVWTKRKEVSAANINPVELQGILMTYVSPAEAEAIGAKKEVQARTRRFKADLAAFGQRYPTRTEEINSIVEQYKKWSNVRQHLDDPADLKRLIAKAGVLEFRIAPFKSASGNEFRISRDEEARYVESLQKEGPEGLRRRNESLLWFPIRDDATEGYGRLITSDYAGKTYVLLYNQPGNMMLHDRRNWSLASARPSFGEYGTPAVDFTLDQRGASLFSKITNRHKGHNMAILLDDEVYSAPTIQSVISERGQITGNYTPADVGDLVRTLRAGSLPARLNPDPVSESTFGPAIGEINRQLGIRAAKFGLIAVAVFMLVYYLLPGFIAVVALALNIVLVLGSMSMLSAVFTLPGIAGLILTIGIAVDANVLIFERLREEQKKSQSVRMALKNAYERAFSAIFDANITTLIVCLILGWVGTEEVRGFAITLGLGVLFSLFTSLVVTRWLFQVMLNLGWLTGQIRMLHVVGIPKINWMGKRFFFWILTSGFVAVGIVSLSWQGSNIWGIEFSAGTEAVVKLNDDALLDGKLPNDKLIREMFIGQATDAGHTKLADTARVEKQIDPYRVRNFLADHDVGDASGAGKEDGKIALAEWRFGKLNEEFFKLIDTDDDGAMTRQELQDNLPASSYQISTTETDARIIRQVARDAFGSALQILPSCSFDLVLGGRSEKLGIDLAADGKTRVTPKLRQSMTPAYRDEFTEDDDGAVIFLIRNVSPAIPRSEMTRRLRDMRAQPDFAEQMLHQTRVIGINPAGGDRETFDSFAIVVGPTEPTILEQAAAWDKFADDENDLLDAALGREKALSLTNFDAAIAGESAQLAIVAVVLSWLAIVAYLWFRFGSVRWGLAAVICLIHDVVIVVGLVAVSGWAANTQVGQWLGLTSFKIDLAMVAAILTVIGYSVNDTIVVFDRIRENRGKLAAVSSTVIDTSINQTLSRTLLTSGTTFIVVFIMYVYGGPGIHAFNYALLVGILFGTYSSVAVASPLLMGLRRALGSKAAGE